MPRRASDHGTETRSRSRAFLLPLLGGLMLLMFWSNMTSSAAAGSYPPALGCAVSGVASAGSGLLEVRGTGFGAGARVVVGVAGRQTGTASADAAGSFQASWLTGKLIAGAAVSATDAGCAATGPLTIGNPPISISNSGKPPAPPATRPEPPPAAEPTAAAIPSIRLTGLPPHLFLGLAGAVLLAGTALTGLAGRLGHRAECPVRPDSQAAPGGDNPW
jgi:hypothetical protein